jgi:hypothetical protein
VAVRGQSFVLRRRTERTSVLVRLAFIKLSAADATVVLSVVTVNIRCRPSRTVLGLHSPPTVLA